MTDTTSINEQIQDSIEQIHKLLSEDNSDNIRLFSYQFMTHAISLAMYNTVHQQQQIYALQNAVTTAATRAILESKPEEALKLAKEGFGTQDITATLASLKDFMDDLHNTYKDIHKGKAAGPATSTEKSTRTAKKPARKRSTGKKTS